MKDYLAIETGEEELFFKNSRGAFDKMLFSEILRNFSSNKRQHKPKIILARLIEAELIEKIEQMNEQLKFPRIPLSTELT